VHPTVVRYKRARRRPERKEREWYIERPVREAEKRLENMVRAGLTAIGIGLAFLLAGLVGLAVLRTIFGRW